MRIEHVAIASRSEEDSKRFFSELLGLEKVREFIVSADLMDQFFGVKKDQKVVRYKNEKVEVEVFITDDESSVKDMFTHICVIVEDKIKLIDRAEPMGFKITKVARKDSDDFYLFLKDSFGNLYEIKSA